MNGKKWFWLNLEQFCWVPYKDVDNQKLNMAWKSNQKSCMIINGLYRVEFTRDGDTPSGQQYNNKIQNPGARNVICVVPAKEINTIPVSNQPL